MKNSKFKEAYLKLIKQDFEATVVPAVVPTVTPNQDTQTDTTTDNVEGLKAVTFKTADEGLLNALANGFDEVVFFVKSTDENGNETVEEVKFGANAFGPFEVVDAVEETEAGAEAEGDVETECGDNSDGTTVGEKEVQEQSNQLTEDEEVPVEEGNTEDNVATECGDSGSECGDSGSEGGDGGEIDNAEVDPEISEEENEDSEIDPSEWLEDGVCVKCGAEDCDGTCKCKKCGGVNCIGDCE